MGKLGIKLRTAGALGWTNIARVAAYRGLLRLGLHPVQRIAPPPPRGPFFAPPADHRTGLPGNSIWTEFGHSFGWHARPLGGHTPNWHENPLTGAVLRDVGRPWWTIPDFDPAVGDIKTIWEASRFGWVLAFAQQARLGDASAVTRLNDWLEDWCRNNPPSRGPNWKCGQESSLRILHLAAATLVLGETGAMLPGLRDFLVASLRRIAPTRSYAIAQDNNHGTSEAAALFVGGSWLVANGVPQGRVWADNGRALLEERVARLVQQDGGFSQYSLTYHRLMLDTLAFAEVWRRRLDQPPFSAAFLGRARAATDWLYQHVDAGTGDAPNLGANDGAHILDLAQTGYRDFRPSVQLAATLFAGKSAYPEQGSWDLPLQWLELARPPSHLPPPCSTVFDDSGFAVLRLADATACLRYPRFRFRPGQADLLHADLWVGGLNHLADAGTYSYLDPSGVNYFAATAGHNTIAFDDRDQMPRLGRFLFGDWAQTRRLLPLTETADEISFGATCDDRRRARHQRRLRLGLRRLVVDDAVSGFAGKAVLRWRLLPRQWTVDGTSVAVDGLRLTISGSVPIMRFEIVPGWRSVYYLQREDVPVLEVEISLPGELRSVYTWQP